MVGLQSPKLPIEVRILASLPVDEASSVLESSCGDTQRLCVNRTPDRWQLTVVAENKNTRMALWEMAQTLPTNKQWISRMLKARQ